MAAHAQAMHDATHSIASRVNSATEQAFGEMGKRVADHPWRFLTGTVLVLFALCLGLMSASFTTSVYELWIENGSRLLNERDFTEQYFGETATRTEFQLGTVRDGSNMLTAERLSEWLNLTKEITNNIYAEVDGTKYYWKDVCTRIPNSALEFPCGKYTVLDCFAEGGFDYFLPNLPAFGLPNRYATRPSFVGKTPEELGYITKNSCDDWAAIPTPENFIMGGVTKDSMGNITNVASFQNILRLRGAEGMASSMFSTTTPTQQQIDKGTEVVQAWEQAYLDKMEILSNRYSFSPEYFTKRSEVDLLLDANAGDLGLIVIGYVAMIAFTMLAQYRSNSSVVTSKAFIGLLGVVLVCLSIFAALGLTVILGITFTPMHLQVLPFLALGLGVDDMFVLAFTWRASKGRGVRLTAQEAMQEAGASITLTSAVNFIAFLIASAVPLPAINSFSISAALAVLVNWFSVLLGFLSLLVINETDDWCCSSDMVEETEAHETADEVTVPASTFQKSIVPTAQPVVVSEAQEDSASLLWISRSLGKVLLHPLGKAVTLAACISVFGVAVWGATQLEDGLPLSDIVPADHYSHDFLESREKHYDSFEAYIITGMNPSTGQIDGTDYSNPDTMRALITLQNNLEAEPYIDRDIPIALVSWASSFIKYCQTSHPGNVTSDGYPLQSSYYNMLRLYLLTSTGQRFASRVKMDSSGRIVASSITFYQKGIRSTNDYVSAIETSRQSLDDEPVSAFPSGFIYNFYEQYMRVRAHLLHNLGFVALGIAVVSLGFLFNPLAVLLMLSVIAIIIMDVYGFLHIVGLKLNGVSVVNVLMALGVSVEFTAHIVRSFMIAKGTRDERVQAALDAMTVPVTLGAFSTILGVASLAFAAFPYYQLYFFNMYVLIVLAGYLNGILLLPVLLSLVGPPSFEFDTAETASKHTAKHPSEPTSATQSVNGSVTKTPASPISVQVDSIPRQKGGEEWREQDKLRLSLETNTHAHETSSAPSTPVKGRQASGSAIERGEVEMTETV